MAGKSKSRKRKWIKRAIKHPGALHRDLGVPADKPIPASKLEKAKHSKNPRTRRRAQLAETLKKLNRGRKRRKRS